MVDKNISSDTDEYSTVSNSDSGASEKDSEIGESASYENLSETEKAPEEAMEGARPPPNKKCLSERISRENCDKSGHKNKKKELQIKIIDYTNQSNSPISEFEVNNKPQNQIQDSKKTHNISKTDKPWVRDMCNVYLPEKDSYRPPKEYHKSFEDDRNRQKPTNHSKNSFNRAPATNADEIVFKCGELSLKDVSKKLHIKVTDVTPRKIEIANTAHIVTVDKKVENTVAIANENPKYFNPRYSISSTGQNKVRRLSGPRTRNNQVRHQFPPTEASPNQPYYYSQAQNDYGIYNTGYTNNNQRYPYNSSYPPPVASSNSYFYPQYADYNQYCGQGNYYPPNDYTRFNVQSDQYYSNSYQNNYPFYEGDPSCYEYKEFYRFEHHRGT